MPRGTRKARPGSTGVGDSAPSVHAVRRGVFRKEGEYWTLGSAGKFFRLKDTRGLGYIAHLLRHPGIEFHVLDLAGGIADHGEDDEPEKAQSLPRGDQDREMLDEQAKVAYRRRLSELREALEEAKEQGNVERAEQAEQEIDTLTSELSRVVGVGERNRRVMSASERARQSISKTIKAVLERIAQNDGALGDVIARCVRTGTFCSYQPDPVFPIEWEFGATIAEQQVQPIPDAETAPARADRSQALPPVLEASPFSLAERTAFVGRETEGRAIRAAIDLARSGQGSLVMLWDGPGVGKTRLAMEMAEYAAGVGFRYSFGRCYERDEPHPYLPFAEIIEGNLAQAASLNDYRRRIGDNAAELAQIAPSLRRVFPDIPPPLELPPAQQRHYLFSSFSEALARMARTSPQLLVLEDLHWADESTLALLIHLANRIVQLPVVIIGTYRGAYSIDNPALVRSLEELIRMGVRPLKLDGLSKDAVAQMLHGLSQRETSDNLVTAIFDESQGYPFFVEEVYRHLVEEGKVFDTDGQLRTAIKIDEIDVPENVRLIISRRLERLDERKKRALAAAAVIGRSFSFQLLTEVSQIDVDELFSVIEKAQQMGIIVPSAEGPERPFTFSHELVRQTLLVGISPPRKERLHAAVADAIERLYPAALNERAGEIADHLYKAGSFAEDEKLVRWLTLAGKSALEAAAFEEARVGFELALSRVDESDSPRRAELIYSLGIAMRGLGRWSEAHLLWEQALEIFAAVADQDSIAQTCIQLAEGAAYSGKRREAVATAERLLAKLSKRTSERALLLAILALGKLDDDEPDAAHQAFIAALSVAEELPDTSVMGAILVFRSKFNFICLRLREALEDSIRSAELISSAPAWIRTEHLLWYQSTLQHIGRIKENDRICQELESLASRIGHLPAMFFARLGLAWTEFCRQPDLALIEKKQRRDLEAQMELRLNPFFVTTMALSTTEFVRGNWDKSLEYAEAGWSTEAPRHVQAMSIAARFRVLAYHGERESALALLNQHPEMLARPGKTNIYGSFVMSVAAAEGLFVLGEIVQAAIIYPVFCELIDMGTICLPMIARFSQTAAGVAAAAARNWDAAGNHFQIAMQQAESYPNVIEPADIRRFHAMMLLDRAATGDRERARTLLNEALETYTQIGMPRHIEMTQALLARCR